MLRTDPAAVARWHKYCHTTTFAYDITIKSLEISVPVRGFWCLDESMTPQDVEAAVPWDEWGIPVKGVEGCK